MASNRPELNVRKTCAYLQGIFEDLSRQENLRVKRFTLAEKFFMEVDVKVSNSYHFIFSLLFLIGKRSTFAKIWRRLQFPPPAVSTGLR